MQSTLQRSGRRFRISRALAFAAGPFGHASLSAALVTAAVVSVAVVSVALVAAALPTGVQAWAAEPAPEGATSPPNVLLITVDTLRPDALGWVAGRNATPAIDRLAATGYRFPAAVTPLPLTQPAHASLLTGLLPRRHGVRSNGLLLSQDIPTLGHVLQQHGYTTGAFVGGFPLAAEGGLDGGFDHYDDDFSESQPEALERRAADTVAAALSWRREVDGPWFLWLHFYDPHDPYEPPPGFSGSGPRGAYDGEVRAVDAAIGQLLAGLGAPHREVLTVFTADHGESLGEHGESTHGFFIYESTMAVPLVISWPNHVAPGESREAVRLWDVAPTVLELLDLPPLDDIDGFSLRPLMEGKAWLTPDAYLESQRPWLSYGWAPLRALRRGPWKLIAAPQPELYHLEDDPSESKNLLPGERRLAGDLAASLTAIEARSAHRATGLDDPETLARLRSLGYTGGVAPAEGPPPDAVDPKLRLGQWHLLGEAQALLDAGKLDEALQRLDRVLKEDPNNPFALGRSGAALAEAGRLQDALPRLRKVVNLRPEDHEGRFALATVATQTGRLEEALEHWLELTRQQPRRVEVWTQLASTLGLSGAPGKAVEAFQQALALDGGRPDVLIKLAFAHHAAGQPQEAVSRLQQAARLIGPQAFPHAGALGILMLRAGHGAAAVPWLQRSGPTEGDYAEAQFQLALWWSTQGDSQAAAKALATALRVRPEWRPRAAAEPLLQSLLP